MNVLRQPEMEGPLETTGKGVITENWMQILMQPVGNTLYKQKYSS